MSAEHDFVSPWKHRALFDALCCIRILEYHNIDEVIRFSELPTVTLAAIGLPYERRGEAKELGFFWNPTRKVWLKKVKAPVPTGFPFRVIVEQ